MLPVSHPAASNNSNSNSAFALVLDIGTSSVRAALYDDRGNQLEQSYVKHERTLQTSLEGGAELDAEQALEQVERAIDATLARSTQLTAQIEIAALSCFWHSLVGVGRDGRALTPVLTWADTRAASAVTELRQLFDERETHARTGCRFHPSYWPAKLLWLQRERAEVFRSAAHWMSLSDMLFERLFGETETSVSMASATGLFNQRKLSWDAELLSRLSLSSEQLPTIAARDKTFSGLKREYARRWPQLEGARWTAAIGDGAANNIGAGCTVRQRAALMIGTSGAMRVMWSGDVPDLIPPELWCYRADGERVIMGGALSDGGGLYRWMTDTLNLKAGDEELERQLALMQPDAHGLTVLPFWSGERSIGWNADAHGAILGLKQHTQPVEIVRAAMEAVAYRFALIAEALEDEASPISFVASGGALRSSPVWTQMIADVLLREIKLSEAREASSRGAVLLALELAGKIKSITDVPALLGRTFEPDRMRHARYREGLERQQKFYTLLVNEPQRHRDTEKSKRGKLKT